MPVLITGGRTFVFMKTFVSRCVPVACACVHMCCMWRPNVSLGCHSSGLFTPSPLFKIEIGSFTWFRTCQIDQAGWPESPRSPSLPPQGWFNKSMHHTHFLFVFLHNVLGMALPAELCPQHLQYFFRARSPGLWLTSMRNRGLYAEMVFVVRPDLTAWQPGAASRRIWF